MRSEHDVLLRTKTITADAGGFSTEAIATKSVYAEAKSVRQSEHYAAEAAGKRADIVLVISADEWNGATEAEYDGAVYSIIRTYQVGRGRVELTCSRM